MSQICNLLSQVNRMERVSAAGADGCTQRFCDGTIGSPGSGGTGDSTGLRLLFGHAPSDHEENVVIMSFLYPGGSGCVKAGWGRGCDFNRGSADVAQIS